MIFNLSSFQIQFISCFQILCTGCDDVYSLANGHVDFNESKRLYGDIVPVTCYEGYEIQGAHFITCQSNGNWTMNSDCVIKGKLLF